MGADARIYFEAVGDLVDLDDSMPEWCRVRKMTRMYEPQAIGSTHRVDVPWRMWSPTYPRGPWWRIAHVLGLLWRHQGVGRIWYGGDSDIACELLTLDRLSDYHREWLESEAPHRRSEG
jgi:hypothetical protein